MLGFAYFIALVKHPPQSHGLRAISFFTTSTCLFPSADRYAIDFRIDGWSCSDKKWKPLDPRAYFPIQADDKESRFQRFSYFYTMGGGDRMRESMHALEAYIEQFHPERDDGLAETIGGIRLSKWTHPLPPPGDDVKKYIYEPLEVPPAKERKDLYYTRESERRAKCGPQ